MILIILSSLTLNTYFDVNVFYQGVIWIEIKNEVEAKIKEYLIGHCTVHCIANA